MVKLPALQRVMHFLMSYISVSSCHLKAAFSVWFSVLVIPFPLLVHDKSDLCVNSPWDNMSSVDVATGGWVTNFGICSRALRGSLSTAVSNIGLWTLSLWTRAKLFLYSQLTDSTTTICIGISSISGAYQLFLLFRDAHILCWKFYSASCVLKMQDDVFWY